jgi:hypothetical protein
MEKTLDLGPWQHYNALYFHMEEAFIEQNLNHQGFTSCPDKAIFSKKYYNDINELNHDKIYDFCFIGSIESNYEARKWVIDFAKKHFTTNSLFINTDNNPNWELLGAFDYSNKNIGYCPKNQPENHTKKVQYRVVKENIDYFEKMCQSKYVLCPAGDSSWSFRFYEVLMCKSIPIVETWHHTYRTAAEAEINYSYILSNNVEQEIVYDDYIKNNTMLFEKNHLL